MSNLLVNSSPSKEFFLNMITKDVTVESCILDLIDNSIDSHKRKKVGKVSKIDIEFSIEEDYFAITDNCGGMSKEDAKNKAFRFGNNEIRKNGALGMYGIGMKRSIFKIGRDFVVESKTEVDSFKVYMTRDEWIELKNSEGDEAWKFYLDDCDFDMECGVAIKIRGLSDSLKSYLKWTKNIENLKTKIASSYRDAIKNDVSIRVNGESIIYADEALYESPLLQPYVNTFILKDANIRVIAGVGDPAPKEAGWNIVCNGRTVIERDRTELTGWESNYSIEDDEDLDAVLSDGSKSIPAFHNDFARFRGYVYIDAEDANKLPLNTTKDGIDRQHPIYEFIFKEMIIVMKKVLPALRKLQEVNRECKAESKVSPITEFSKKSLISLSQQSKNKFVLDLENYKASDKIKSVPMYVNEKELIKLKRFFEVNTNKELGEKMYNFVLERVLLDE